MLDGDFLFPFFPKLRQVMSDLFVRIELAPVDQDHRASVRADRLREGGEVKNRIGGHRLRRGEEGATAESLFINDARFLPHGQDRAWKFLSVDGGVDERLC